MWPLWEKPCVTASFVPMSATGPHTNASSMRRCSVFCGAMRPPSRFSRLWPHPWMLYGSTRETLLSSGPGAPRPVPGGVHRGAGGLSTLDHTAPGAPRPGSVRPPRLAVVMGRIYAGYLSHPGSQDHAATSLLLSLSGELV